MSGLPTLTFTLRKAAASVASRTAQGAVALIVKDTADGAAGVHTVYQEADIPAALGADNKAYIKRALIGHINRPSVVYVSVIGSTGTVTDGFSALSGYSYDYLAGPPDIATADATALAGLVKTARSLRYVGKAVLPNTAADSEGVINFVSAGIKVGGSTFTAAQYCSRIAGMLAGTPADCSATYAPLPEVSGVTATASPDTAVAAGKLFILDDGRQRKLSRAVTSKTTVASTEPSGLKKIKVTAAMDLIRYYAVTAVEDDYLGRCANSYDNKCILLTAMRDYLAGLESSSVLEGGSSGAELDSAAIRTYLMNAAQTAGDQEETERLRALSDEEIVKENTGSHVFLRLYGRVLDAMEDFDIVLETGDSLD